MSLAVVHFYAGECACAIAQHHIAALYQFDAPVADAPPLNLRELLNLGSSPRQQRLLKLHTHRDNSLQTWWLAVEEPVTLATLKNEQIYPLPPLVATHCRHPALRALALTTSQQLLLLFDPEHLYPFYLKLQGRCTKGRLRTLQSLTPIT
ncbi:MAG: hypothetical protein HQL49_10880 [Gammaproteobacteria bacterium]|nr:hypothetical protein [Gammaproteobacteria bacterium]